MHSPLYDNGTRNPINDDYENLAKISNNQEGRRQTERQEGRKTGNK